MLKSLDAMATNSADHGESTLTKLEVLHSTEGVCDIAYLSGNGRFMVSVGTDGKVAASDPSTSPPVRSWMVRVAGAGGKLSAAAVSPDGNWLALGQEYAAGFGVWVHPLDQKTGLGKVKLAARYTLSVRHLSWHPTKPLLGIATDDGKLSVWDRGSSRKRDFPTGTNYGGARCVAFDPQGELVAAAFTSGALVVYSLQDTVERYHGSAWPKSVIGSERLILAWRPDGGVLALPGTSAVRLVKRGEYASTEKLLEGGHRYISTVAAWSGDGMLLATGSAEAVALWRPAEKAPLAHIFRLTVAPYSLTWGGDLLVAGTTAGSWVMLPVLSEVSLQAPQQSQEVSSSAAGATGAEGDQQENADGGLASGADSQQDSQTQVTNSADTLGNESVSMPVEKVVQHAPFQPGATSADARRRYLAWNEHGVLKFYVTEDRGREESSRRVKSKRSREGLRPSAPAAGVIAVEYSRERGRCAVREIRAPDGLLLGALGPGICALATANAPGFPARIIVHLSVPWEKPSFEHSLPDDGERIEALAVGRNFVAALTSRRQLRVQTLTGVPAGVLALAGAPVCLAACEDLLLCVTFAPGPQGAEPALEYALYGVSAKERLAAGRLPLSPSASLRWIGFSAEALPMALDTAGVLRVLALSGGAPLLASSAGEWVPVAELEDAGSRLWPVRAEGGSLYWVEASKDTREPRVGAVQRLQALRYRLPLGSEAEGAERLLRLRFTSAHMSFALDSGLIPTAVRNLARDAVGQRARTDSKEVLKLFESAAKAGELEQALDIATNYFNAQAGQEARLLQDARTLATTLGHEVLSDKVAQLLEAVERAEREAKSAAQAAASALEALEKSDDEDDGSASSEEESGSEAGDASQGGEQQDQPLDVKSSGAASDGLSGSRRTHEEAGLADELPPAVRLKAS